MNSTNTEIMTIEQIAAELTGLPIRADSPRMSGKVTMLILSKLANRLDLLIHLAAINGQRAAAASIAEQTLQHLAAQAGKDAEVYSAIQSGDITGLYESLGVKVGIGPGELIVGGGPTAYGRAADTDGEESE